MDISQAERKRIAALVGDQAGTSTPFILAVKIVAVLKWRYRAEKDPTKRAMEIFEDFAESLTKRGARLKLQ